MRIAWVLTLSLAFVPTLKADEPPVSPEKVQAASEAEKAGAYAAAEALLLEVVRDAEKLGENDPRLADALERLGGYYMLSDHQDFDNARVILERALAIREKANDAESSEAAEDLFALAFCYLARKDVAKAQHLLDRSQEICEKTGGAKLAKVLRLESDLLITQGKIEGAEKKLLRALAVLERSLGPDDPKTASMLVRLGDLNEVQADVEDARFSAEVESTLRLAQSVLKGRHPCGGSSDLEKAEARRVEQAEAEAVRHGERAKSYYERALKIREQALGPDDPKVAEVLLHLAALEKLRQRPSDAERPLKRCLEIVEARNLPIEDETPAAYVMFAEIAAERGDFDEAERRLDHVREVFASVKDLDHKYTRAIFYDRLKFAMKRERFEEAESFIKGELKLLEDQMDLDDPDMRRARDLLASTNFKQERDNADAPLLWSEMKKLRDSLHDKEKEPGRIWDLLWTEAKLLRQTNRVVPQVSRKDLDYFKKRRTIPGSADLDWAAEIDPIHESDAIDALIDDAVLAHLRGFVLIEELTLNNPGVTDAGLRHLRFLKNLKRLDLFGSEITSRGVEQLRSLPKLEDLTLSHTRVDDSAIETLAKFPSLQVLLIEHTRITPEGVEKLKGLRPDLVVGYEEGYHKSTRPVQPTGAMKEPSPSSVEARPRPRHFPRPEPTKKPPLPPGFKPFGPARPRE